MKSHLIALMIAAPLMSFTASAQDAPSPAIHHAGTNLGMLAAPAIGPDCDGMRTKMQELCIKANRSGNCEKIDDFYKNCQSYASVMTGNGACAERTKELSAQCSSKENAASQGCITAQHRMTECIKDNPPKNAPAPLTAPNTDTPAVPPAGITPPPEWNGPAPSTTPAPVSQEPAPIPGITPETQPQEPAPEATSPPPQ